MDATLFDLDIVKLPLSSYYLVFVLFCLDAKKNQKSSRKNDAPARCAGARPPFFRARALAVLYGRGLGRSIPNPGKTFQLT